MWDPSGLPPDPRTLPARSTSICPLQGQGRVPLRRPRGGSGPRTPPVATRRQRSSPAQEARVGPCPPRSSRGSWFGIRDWTTLVSDHDFVHTLQYKTRLKVFEEEPRLIGAEFDGRPWTCQNRIGGTARVYGYVPPPQGGCVCVNLPAKPTQSIINRGAF